MEKTVTVPSGTNVDVHGFHVKVHGSKGTLERDFATPLFASIIKLTKDGDKIKVLSSSDKRTYKAMVGTIVAHINSMIKGVNHGYTRKLKIVFMHFPFTVKVNGDTVFVTNFLGEKSPRKSKIVGNTKVEIKGDEIIVTGINKEDVGQTAGNLETTAKVKRFDRRVFQDGIFIIE